MISKKGQFLGGIAMFIGFLVVLVIMFFPVFKGQNALQYLDSLYNSISKGSAYYVPAVREDVGKYVGKSIHITLKAKSEEEVPAGIRGRCFPRWVDR